MYIDWESKLKQWDRKFELWENYYNNTDWERKYKQMVVVNIVLFVVFFTLLNIVTSLVSVN